MPLEEAIAGGDPQALRAAIRAGCDVNRRGRLGLSPLMIAAGLGRCDMVALLLAAGADPHMLEPRMGATALHKAAQSGDTDMIALLLDNGAFVDQQSTVLGNTPLTDATLHKHEAAVRLLLDRGARTQIRNHWGQSAVELAREDGLDAIVQHIERRDAADAEQVAALTLIAAVRAGDIGEVRRSISAGSDLDQRLPIVGSVDDDYTALGIAVRERNIDILRVLLEAGADPHLEIGLMRGTLVHEASFLGYADVLRLLLGWRGKDEDDRIDLGAVGPYNGLTALHDAVWHGHFEAAKALVQAGAPLALRTHAGLTPRELALLYGYHDLALMLAEAEGQQTVQRSDSGTA